jgi:hypothetical protein
MDKLFLARYPEKPVMVPVHGMLSIGRAGTNDVILTELRVSRKHARIQWERVMELYTLVDVGSSNGTFLNGKKIPAGVPSPLYDGDKIRFASSVYTVRLAAGSMVIENEFKNLQAQADMQNTEVYTVFELLSERGKPMLAGKLESLCPLELFQILDLMGKTGTLEIRTAEGDGTFSVSKGRIVAAAYRQNRGQAAVYDVLKSTSGTFVFRAHSVHIDRPEITMSTTVLLMQGCQMLDEEAMARTN